MTGIRRALVLVSGERYFRLLVNLGALAAVSRILTPEEIGVSIIGMAVVGLIIAAREFASENFLIQKKDLTVEDMRSAVTVMLVISLLLASVLVISGKFLSSIYREDGLTIFLSIASLCFLVETISLPALALMRRDMEFGKVSFINVASATTIAASTITLAMLGHSYMSFVWGWLMGAIVAAALVICFRPEFLNFKPRFTMWKEMLVFGGYNGLNVALYRIYESVPYLMFGRILSLEATAFYQRSANICHLPNKVLLGGVMSVTLSAFSLETREGRDLKNAYLGAIEYVTGVQWPALVVLAVLAYPVVATVLGAQWLEIVPLVQIMAISALFSFSFELNYPLFVAVGAMRDAFLRSLIIWPTSTLILIVAAHYGLMAVALSLLIAMPFQAAVSLYFVRRHVYFRWRELGAVLRKSAVVTLAGAAGPAVIVFQHGQFDISLWATAGAVALSALGWLCGLWAVNHPLLHELLHAARYVGQWKDRWRPIAAPQGDAS